MQTIEEVKKYIDREYWEEGDKSGYKDSFLDISWNCRWAQCFNQVIPIFGKKILDLGCGIGGFVSACNLWGADAYGVDLSNYAVSKHKSECERLHLPADRVFEGSCHDLSRWEPETFDIIYSNQVFEHIPKQYIDGMVAEIHRVTKHGAILWFGLQMPEKEGIVDPKCIDETHITLMPREWWDEKFLSQGVEKTDGFDKADDIDQALRETKTGQDNYSFFKEYDWRSLAYRKL